MVKWGSNGIGMSKHRKSGRGGPSPKVKLRRELEERKRGARRRVAKMTESVKDLFR